MKSHIYIYTTIFVVMLSVVTICEAVQPTSVTTGPNGVVTTEDGVILISQSKKTTFPIIINQPGSYRLSSNLTVPADTNGIVINADNVTLDLNGFSLIGSGSLGEGITTSGVVHTAITIRNGTITNFNIGIDLTERSDVEQIRVHVGTGSGGGISVGSNSRISKNTVDGGTTGISTAEKSIVSGNTIQSGRGIVTGQGCIVNGNLTSGGSDGMILGQGSTVSGNTVLNNTHGVTIAIASTISGNTVSFNTTGMIVDCPSNLVGNTVIGNTEEIVENNTGCTRANNNPAP